MIFSARVPLSNILYVFEDDLYKHAENACIKECISKLYGTGISSDRLVRSLAKSFGANLGKLASPEPSSALASRFVVP
jgi:hypothetical protein